MKVTFELPVDGLNADIKAYDAEGNEVEVARLEIEPYFYTPRSVTPLLYGRVKAVPGLDSEGRNSDKEVETHRFVLAVSGVTATCRLSGRGDPQLSAFEADDDKDPEDDDDN